MDNPSFPDSACITYKQETFCPLKKENSENILQCKATAQERRCLTQPNANGRLFPVPRGTVATGGG